MCVGTLTFKPKLYNSDEINILNFMDVRYLAEVKWIYIAPSRFYLDRS